MCNGMEAIDCAINRTHARIAVTRMAVSAVTLLELFQSTGEN